MTLTITPPAPGPVEAWSPIRGERTDRFVDERASGPKPMNIEPVVSEATEILSHCTPPTESRGDAVVLAVGYVQSGKTLSFTTLINLAGDNGFGVVILLAGTTTNLKGQSEDRLRDDLGFKQLQRHWRHFDNPQIGSNSFTELQVALRSWKRFRSGSTIQEKPAVIITLLKHSGRIQNAARALSGLPLEGVPVLIIDDESDQASPNTKANSNKKTGRRDESATYSALSALRASLPHHSLVQYTATPQANLLLATADQLNPNFAKVLSSGPGYTGGKVFFHERVQDLVIAVPNAESFDPKNPLTEPPDGLQMALRIFLLGVADATRLNIDENRSMMVQAHQNTTPHQIYRSWIRSLLDDWRSGLESGGAYAEEVTDDFLSAYEELKRTVAGLGDFGELTALLPEVIDDLNVVEVNSTEQAEKEIDWNRAHFWILIGGMKLDRGFTVEGLTVTYMPRPISANADVLQQRARFFGYRGGFIDYCRVFLREDVKTAFIGYVDNEESLRKSLKDHEGQPMSAWKRDLVLHNAFASPTRQNVVGRATSRGRASGGWSWPRRMHLGEDIRRANEDLFRGALELCGDAATDAATLLPDVVDLRAGKRNLAVTGVQLDEALELILRVRVADSSDSMLMQSMGLQLARMIRDPQESDPKSASVVFMNGLDIPSGSGRQLSVVQQNLLVGMNPSGARGSAVRYSGDRKFVWPDEVTIQLRILALTDAAPAGQNYSSVPWIALHLPGGLEHGWLVEV